MKPSLLSRLHWNGVSYLTSGLLLLIGIPLYQVFFLYPTGLSNALNETGTGQFPAYFAWISQHSFQFIVYRALLILAFALLFTLPFSLYRIIVAQELMSQQEQPEVKEEGEAVAAQEGDQQPEQGETDDLPAYAWQGRGFVVLAAWAGTISLAIYVLSAIASTLYFVIAAGNIDSSTAAMLSGIFTISTNTIGIGLLGLSILFFGATICRTGLNLWPTYWVIFGYAAILIGGLLCISSIAVASPGGAGQNTITTIAILLFALWVFWLGLMLVRLKSE